MATCVGFFPGLSAPTLERIAARLVHKHAEDGYNFFHKGQPADRLYLFDEDERNRRPRVVEAGAMLTIVAETMLPEAFHKGGGVVGLSTLAGFLIAVYFNTL